MSKSSSQNAPEQPLALPPPSADTADATRVNASGDTVKFDELGPLVVNADGTLSRIANWSSMTEEERARTIRVLGARNKIRLANQEAQQGTTSETAA